MDAQNTEEVHIRQNSGERDTDVVVGGEVSGVATTDGDVPDIVRRGLESGD